MFTLISFNYCILVLRFSYPDTKKAIHRISFITLSDVLQVFTSAMTLIISKIFVLVEKF